MATPEQISFRDRWLADAVVGFPNARELGATDRLSDYLDDLHRFRHFTDTDLAAIDLPEEIRSFLLTNGLPEDAPPFLSLASRSSILQPVTDAWPALADRIDLRPFLSFYVDSSGSPLCIDRRDGRVVLFDHDFDFSVSVFVNRTVVTFAEFLLIAQRIKLGLPLVISPAELDVDATQPGTFWAREFAELSRAAGSA